MTPSNSDLALLVLADATAGHAGQLAAAAGAERRRQEAERVAGERAEAERLAARRAAEDSARCRRIIRGALLAAAPALLLFLGSPLIGIGWLVLVGVLTLCAATLSYPAGREVVSRPAAYAFGGTLFLVVVQACSSGASADALWLPPIAAVLVHAGYGLVRTAGTEQGSER